MANIALRNPQFKSIAIPASGVLSTVCTVTIDGTLRYTLVKNVGSAVNSSDIGVEAYGTFLEGVNPTLPFLDSSPTWLISKNYSNNIHEIFVPENTSGTIPYIYDGGQGDIIGVVNFSSTDDEVDGAPNVNTDVKINRINCTKYGIGTKVIFINKFGVPGIILILVTVTTP